MTESYSIVFFSLGDSGFQFSKDVWKKLFQFSAIFNPGDRTLRVMGHFTQLGEKELSEQAHTLEVYCQIPPHYGKLKLRQIKKSIFFDLTRN